METVDKDIRIYKAPISLLNFKHTHNQRQQLTTPILFCGFVFRFKWLAIEFLETKLVPIPFTTSVYVYPNSNLKIRCIFSFFYGSGSG